MKIWKPREQRGIWDDDEEDEKKKKEMNSM